MARRLLHISSSLLLAIPLITATFAADSNSVKIAVYWGQSAREGSLNDTCRTGLYAFVNIAFLAVFGSGQAPSLNLAGHCDVSAGTCVSLSADIAYCQSLGVKVLLSIGGGTDGYNLSSASDAKYVATYLWNNFLDGTATSRPLGNAVLDGIDFDIAAGSSLYYDDLAKQLVFFYRGANRNNSYMLTAAPECPYPDASLDAALRTGLFDCVWVQFYNNPPCQYAAEGVGALQDAWEKWTRGFPTATFFLGLPASPDAAPSGGYIDAETLARQVVPVLKRAANYGGVMLWSRFEDKNSGYSAKLQNMTKDLEITMINTTIPTTNNATRPNTTFSGDGSPMKGSKKTRTYIIAGAGSLFGICIVLLAFLLWYKKYHGLLPWQSESTDAPSIESFLERQGTSHPKRYTYSEVKRMTRSFGHKLGQGGYGVVYRGSLPDGREVAVKVLKNSKGDGEQFKNEVASISKTSHVNVVTLLGFCLQGPKRALIYEYMPNGSLEKYAFGSNSEGEKSLSWEKLFDIIVGIARGLEYLHRGCNTRIVHFDIKPQNILLHQDFCPKISDFGLAKLSRPKESKISIGGARGTIGYIAPEVFSRQYGAVTSKSDVYSYGMVVLEMIGARKNCHVSAESSSKYFPQWLYENLDQFCVSAYEISDETIELVKKMIIVGLWCIQLTPTDRPSMSKVIEMLESHTKDLQLPPMLESSTRNEQLPVMMESSTRNLQLPLGFEISKQFRFLPGGRIRFLYRSQQEPEAVSI